jgi:hypothetical protein
MTEDNLTLPHDSYAQLHVELTELFKHSRAIAGTVKATRRSAIAREVNLLGNAILALRDKLSTHGGTDSQGNVYDNVATFSVDEYADETCGAEPEAPKTKAVREIAIQAGAPATDSVWLSEQEGEAMHDEELEARAKAAADYSPGSFGCHEALHMAHVIQDMTEDHLVQHPAIAGNPEWKGLADAAAEALLDLYQAIGAKHL